MDDKYKDYLSYLEFLHRIGRRVGCRTEAEKESMKMTREEQIKLSGLMLMNDKDSPYIHVDADIENLLIFNTDEAKSIVIKNIQDQFISEYYNGIEELLDKITKAEISNE
jgi:hypothetical protein